MEVAQKYTLGFHRMMSIFKTLPPDIEPRASGHIPEQIRMVAEILKNGLAYQKHGSVYFDTRGYQEGAGEYGILSGRKTEDLLAESRDDLKNQDEKNHPGDFALWMRASPEHIMRWDSPWGEGFPGWHLECSAMSLKYLGKVFDIHGGGNDLKFPHHENEIAQNMGACQCAGARYWLHTNMLLLNGRKMSKSDGNTISPDQLFTGDSPHITHAYSPMAVKFFMLQCHYRSTLDLTDAALQAAEKGYRRLMDAYRWLLATTHPGKQGSGDQDDSVLEVIRATHMEMADDVNTPKVLARLFELVNRINALKDGHMEWAALSPDSWQQIQVLFRLYVSDILALDGEELGAAGVESRNRTMDGLMELIIHMRNDARSRKDWATADLIRDALKAQRIVLKDGKEGTGWSLEAGA